MILFVRHVQISIASGCCAACGWSGPAYTFSFRRINLLEAQWAVQGPLDVIFCRNVMIYFDKPTQYTILKRFSPLLRPDGLLFAGHSESFMHAADLFRSLGRTVYALKDSPRP